MKRRRILAAKVFRVSIDTPLRPLEVEDRYREALLVVQSHGAVIGRVWLPALSVIPAHVQEAAIASELGSALWQEQLTRRLNLIPSAGAGNGRAGRPALRTSVVVCTRDRPAQLKSCLESLMRLASPPHDILVVDNVPTTDDTRELCQAYPVRYVREEHSGTARARNRGIREATGDLVAFTDDDCVVDPHWLDGIDLNFADPLVMAVTGAIEPLELETSAQYLLEIHGVFTRIDRRRVVDGLSVEPVGAPYHLGATANVVFRRDAFEAVGLFSEDFGAGTPILTGEDPELFYRILAAGYRIVTDPCRLVWHQHRREYDRLEQLLFSYTLAVTAHCLRCLLRGREPGAIRLMAHLWFRHFPRDLWLILKGDDRRLPFRLLLAEVAGAIVAPWRLLRTTLRRPAPPLPEPPERAIARPPRMQIESDAPPLSVVIPSYNRREPLKRLLESLGTQRYPNDRFEVLAVIDGSTDGTAQLARSLDLPYELRVIEQANSGASAARNRGAEEATAPVVVFIDDDVIPDADFLVEHALAHSGQPQVALGYTPPVIEEDGLWPLILRAWWEDHFRRKADPNHQWTWVDIIAGNLSMPRRLYLDVGGLNIEFRGRGREDWELGIRLLQEGARFAYIPRAKGMHHLDTRFSTRLEQMRQEARDDVLLSSKHPAVMGQLLLAQVAQRLGDGDTWLARAYRHGRLGEGAAQTALPTLALLEQLRARRRWRRLAQTLLGHAYMRGVADVFPTPEQFIEFFAPAWSAPKPRLPILLDASQNLLPLPPVGPIELELEISRQSIARLSALEGESQWDWDKVAEHILRDESRAIMDATVANDLTSASAREHRPRTAKALHAD